MKFNDCGIIISQKKYGENSLIVKVFSQHHGIYRGFVKSVKSSKDKVIFQIGNLISFEFRSRVEDNLGQFFSVDLVRSYCSRIIFEPLKVDCVNSLFSIIDDCFLERENQQNLFEKLQLFLQKIGQDDERKASAAKSFLADYIRLELKILKTLGYEIDLSVCAVTNSTIGLAFVSPKSARAVCLEVGRPYQNRLLKLPSFLVENDVEISQDELLQGLRLSGYFLEKFIFENRQEKLSIRKKIERICIQN
jgi:DNA repair protein RecO (recombination protein O)